MNVKFKFFIGGYFGGHFELVLKKKHLVGIISDYPFPPLSPSHSFPIKDDPDWMTLLQYLKTLKWKATYVEAGTCDGTQWTLDFRYEDIHLKCYGSNAYPRGFKKLLQLINNVTKKYGVDAKL